MSTKDYQLDSSINEVINNQYEDPEVVIRYKKVGQKLYYLQEGRTSEPEDTRTEITDKLTSKQKDYVQASLKVPHVNSVELTSKNDKYSLVDITQEDSTDGWLMLAYVLFAILTLFVPAMITSFAYDDEKAEYKRFKREHEEHSKRVHQTPAPWTV